MKDRFPAMDKRAFLKGAGASALMTALLRPDLLPAASYAPSQVDFSWPWLIAHARELARAPFKAPGAPIAAGLAGLDYDHYRDIQYKPQKGIWRNEPIDFELQFFHLGYLYNDPVDIFIVQDGAASRLKYNESLFRYGAAEKLPGLSHTTDAFSGWRLHGPLETPGILTEYLVFQGRSYFRSRAKSQRYGLSARGLAVNTARPGGEEFPVFRAFWIAKPEPGDKSITFYALLDGASIAGAYRFVCSAASDVVMDIECQLFPRRPLPYVGIAPFSSMFWFGPSCRRDSEDFRVQVHDSDGLAVLTSKGEWLWRPLVAGSKTQYSRFPGGTPGGFGLMQRCRKFEEYQDLEAAYQKRPSAWVEPLNDWGKGSVDLVEIPTASEYNDNIVAFWCPEKVMQPDRRHVYSYRLTWSSGAPIKQNVARVHQTRIGKGQETGSYSIVVDFSGDRAFENSGCGLWEYDIGASAGLIEMRAITTNPFIGGKRVVIEYYPDRKKVPADLTFQIRRSGRSLTEKWVYRWLEDEPAIVISNQT